MERAGGIGAWYFASYRGTVAYQGINREPPDLGFRDAIEGLVERARDVPWPSAGDVWDRVTGAGQPLHSDFRAQDEEWDRMAAETHGEISLPGLKRKQDGRSWQPWPDNCAEGRDILRAHGVATLERLGAPEAAPQAGAAASGPGM